MIKLQEIDYETFSQDVYPKYTRIFPANERQSQRELMSANTKGILKFIQIYDDDTKIGLIIYGCLPKNPYVWLDHFAIYPQFRHQKYATKTVQAFKDYFASYDGVYSEIERYGKNKTAKENLNSGQRIEFWESLGFELLDIDFEIFGNQYSTCVLKLNDNPRSNFEIVNYGFSLYEEIIGYQFFQENCTIINKTKVDKGNKILWQNRKK